MCVFAAALAALAGVLAACSPAVVDPAPSFPTVLDPPPVRSDTPLDPEQVQRATDDLISARKQLDSEVNGVGERDTALAAKAKPLPAPKKKPRKPATQSAAVNPAAAGGAATPAAGSSAKP
jgi:hypothetical protein